MTSSKDMTPAEAQKYHDEGYHARCDNIGINSNPYFPFSKERSAFYCGWCLRNAEIHETIFNRRSASL